MCDVNLTERLAPYLHAASSYYVSNPTKGEPRPNVTYGPETRIETSIDALFDAADTTRALRKENLDLRLRLIAAICDRPGMDPTVKADVLTEIAHCRELVSRW